MIFKRSREIGSNYSGNSAFGIYDPKSVPFDFEENVYDGFNRLISTTTNKNTLYYGYYPNGLRASKTVDGVTTKFVWDNDQIVMEADGNNNVTNIYSFGINRICSTNTATNANQYYIYNPHGDVQGLTDVNGTLTKTYDYDAFGVEANKNANDTNPFRYCGEYYDKETGNIYLRARYYNPSTGSFISEDPVRDGYNWYAYCAGNPVNCIDSTGLDHLIMWSYGQDDVGDFEKYLDGFNTSVKRFNIKVDKRTGDWDSSIWEDFDARSPFSRAARTKKQELISKGIPESEILFVRIDNLKQLKDIWSKYTKKENSTNVPLVEGLYFFSHGWENSADIYNTDCQMFWESTDKLNWSKDASAYFYGCNTAKGFAQMFADRQGVNTYGQSDYTYFTENPNFIKDIGTFSDRISKDVYMRTFPYINIIGINKKIIIGRNKNGEGVLFKPSSK